MPLYNNILLSKRSEDQSTSSSSATPSIIDTSKSPLTTASASMKFLQDHLRSKKRSKHLTASQQNSKSRQLDVKAKNSENTLPIRRFCGEPCDWDPQDEYDPMAPNSYEILQSDYLKAEEQRLIAAAMSKHNKSSSIGRIDTSLLDALDELDSVEDTNVRSNRGTAIAPPPIFQLTSTTNQHKDSPQDLDEDKMDTCNQRGSATQNQSDKSEGLSVAAKIMSKMGYKPGQGLGKDEQGISVPLEVEMGDTGLGRIIQGPQVSKKRESDSPLRQQQQSKDMKAQGLGDDQTRVLLLQNMVGPGEVDDDLEAETKEESTKYGQVVKCLIYEIPNKRVPDDQAVRIFVEFKTKEGALKALNDLNGRYFGGRVVRASFYDLDCFNRYELGH